MITDQIDTSLFFFEESCRLYSSELYSEGTPIILTTLDTSDKIVTRLYDVVETSSKYRELLEVELTCLANSQSKDKDSKPQINKPYWRQNERW